MPFTRATRGALSGVSHMVSDLCSAPRRQGQIACNSFRYFGKCNFSRSSLRGEFSTVSVFGSNGSPAHGAFLRPDEEFDFFDRTVDDYAKKTVHPITVKELMDFGRTMSESKLLRSARFVQDELPLRLARRLQSMQSLPYIVAR